MKTAVTKSKEPITANAAAPIAALCPACGGTVLLRKRRLMDGGITYFWRHGDNRHLTCQRRSTRFR